MIQAIRRPLLFALLDGPSALSQEMLLRAVRGGGQLAEVQRVTSGVRVSPR